METKDCKGKKRQIYGTIYFEGNGAIFDQLLVSQGLLLPNSGLKVREETARVELFPEMVDSRAGEGPIRFGLAKGNVAENVNTNGFSDHFPVSVVIEETSTT